MNKAVKQLVLPLLAAAIWGSAFVFQHEAASSQIPAFAFNGLRCAAAAVALGLLILVIRFVNKDFRKKKTNKQRQMLIIGGICCGLCLSFATNLQQIGIGHTSAGKAGFLTALYIILVPIISILLKKKIQLTVAISAVIALVGLFCLCITEKFTIELADIFLILCALAFAVHILCIDYFTNFVNGIELSFLQFLICSVISLIISLFTESCNLNHITLNIHSILYVGIISGGVAYTLQIIAQKGTNPTVVSLILSLESLFGALCGAIFLKEVLTPREYIGGALMLSAVILAQIPIKTRKALSD